MIYKGKHRLRSLENSKQSGRAVADLDIYKDLDLTAKIQTSIKISKNDLILRKTEL